MEGSSHQGLGAVPSFLLVGAGTPRSLGAADGSLLHRERETSWKSLTSKGRRKTYIYTSTAASMLYPLSLHHQQPHSCLHPCCGSLQPEPRSKVFRAWKVDASAMVRGRTLNAGYPKIHLPSDASPTASCSSWMTPHENCHKERLR